MAKKKKEKPQWIRLWADKYYDMLDVENLEEEYSDDPKEKQDLIHDLGLVFLNLLIYYQHYYQFGGDQPQSDYKLKTRTARAIYSSLKRDVRQSYAEYEKRVENGMKGGRPPIDKDNEDDNFS